MQSNLFLEPFVYVNFSSIQGKGIFISKDIAEGENIMVIKGEVISEEECIKREDKGNVYIFWNDDSYIDVEKTTKIKYINHNCVCNCIVDSYDNNSLLLIANRNILANEELTIDYGYDEIYDECNCEKCNSK